MFHFQKILIRDSINISAFFYNFEKNFIKIKFNKFAVNTDYSSEIVSICKSIQGFEWDP
jgi:hypothetical protein